MLSDSFTIRDEFPPVDYDQWREAVEADLKGAPFDKKLVTHTYEGIDIRPIYAPKDFPGGSDPYGFPGLPPFVRGSRPLGAALTGVDLRQEHAHPDLAATNQAILSDLAGGVTSLLLRLDLTACSGRDVDQGAEKNPADSTGLLAYAVDDLDAALDDVHLDMVGVALESGAAFLPASALLTALWKRRGIAPEEARGAFNADPLAVLAREGELPQEPEVALSLLGDLAQWTSQNCTGVTAVAVDTSPYHHAGATAAQDLAFGLATGVAYLRAMTDAGLDIDAAAGQILLRMSLGTHHFLAIAKLRAARRLWWQVVEACGGTESAGAPQIHARTSDRVLTRRDPYVNILRNSVGAFAACIGGADVVTSVPFDQAVGLPDESSRRVARNTVHILQEEAHSHRVVDPSGGSWFLETITDQLAEEAWSIFQEVERRGGMLAVLQCGWVAEQIDSAYSPRAKDIASRKEGITGVSEFPNITEQHLSRTPLDNDALRVAASRRVQVARNQGKQLEFASAESKTAAASEAAAAGATIGQLATALGFHTSPVQIEPLEARSFAEPFEELRDATDLWQATQGQRPRVFLANMGPVAHHTARAMYAKNFFEAGGFEVVTNDGFQEDADAAADSFRESGASIGVICSSDKLYPKLVPRVAGELKAAGARSVVLAGNPGEHQSAWRDAGVDRFIFMKCDVLATLRELLQEEGVLTT